MTITANLIRDLRLRTGISMMECKKALVSSGGDIDLAIEQLRKSSTIKAASKSSRATMEGSIVMAIHNRRGFLLEVNSETDFVANDDNFVEFSQFALDTALAENYSDLEALLGNRIVEERRSLLVQKVGENITLRRLGQLTADVVGGYIHSNRKMATVVGLEGGDEQLAKEVAMHITATKPLAIDEQGLSTTLVEKERKIFSAQAAESGKPAAIVEKMVAGRMQKYIAENCLLKQPFVKNPDVNIATLIGAAKVKQFIRFEVGEVQEN